MIIVGEPPPDCLGAQVTWAASNIAVAVDVRSFEEGRGTLPGTFFLDKRTSKGEEQALKTEAAVEENDKTLGVSSTLLLT